MIRYEKEIKCSFDALLDYCDSNPTGIYILVYPKKKIEAKFETMCEDDNGLELEDTRQEEYNSIEFRTINGNIGIICNYHNMPKEIWCNGKRIL